MVEPWAHDLSGLAILCRDDSSRWSQRLRAVAGTTGFLADAAFLIWAPARLVPALELLPSPLPTQTLIELLKYPLCVGEVRRVVLDQLQRHYDRPFADQWEFVRFAEERKLGLDLISPPGRPETVAAGR